MSGTKCGRWNPTTEQVKVLTELFRSGLRTPSSDQIQMISNQLSFYGKIESKNVFYWFQNHKARERQKRRRVSVDHFVDINTANYTFSSPPTYFREMNLTGSDHQREPVRETLQLFPLSTFDETHDKSAEKARLHTNYGYGSEVKDYHHLPVPLDLGLSSFL